MYSCVRVEFDALQVLEWIFSLRCRFGWIFHATFSPVSRTLENRVEIKTFDDTCLQVKFYDTCLTAILQDEWTTLVSWYQNVSILDFIRAKDGAEVGDSWSCNIKSNRHHHQTNTQLFTGWVPFLLPSQQCQCTGGGGSSTVHGLAHLEFSPTVSWTSKRFLVTLQAKLSGAVYCYQSCLWACLQRVGGVCYHDNSKLHALSFTKLVLQVQVVTISS